MQLSNSQLTCWNASVKNTPWLHPYLFAAMAGLTKINRNPKLLPPEQMHVCMYFTIKLKSYTLIWALGLWLCLIGNLNVHRRRKMFWLGGGGDIFFKQQQCLHAIRSTILQWSLLCKQWVKLGTWGGGGSRPLAPPPPPPPRFLRLWCMWTWKLELIATV